MKPKFSERQLEQITFINSSIEQFRAIKEDRKKTIKSLTEDILNADIQISKLRIELGTIKPIEEVKVKTPRIENPKETEEEKIIRLTKELEEIRSRIKN